jgi:hypothetical protein
MISDDTVDKALEWLSQNAQKAAKARAERIFLEGYTKHLVAKLARASEASSVSGKEQEAYASHEYLEHLEAVRITVEADEHLRWLQSTADAKLEAWRTYNANQRAQGKIG